MTPTILKQVPRTALRWLGCCLVFVALAAGALAGPRMLVEQSDGTALVQTNAVASWGSGAAKQPAGLRGIKAISAGYAQAVALREDGTVVSWGDNRSGVKPVPAGLVDVVAIVSGYQHSLALRRDGTVVAWGTDFAGCTVVPAGLTGVKAIAAGSFTSLALKEDGTVVAWGWKTVTDAMPSGLTDVVAIAGGYTHAMALKRDGTVVAWGMNGEAQRLMPEGLSDVVAISAGWNYCLALKRNGKVVGWGATTFGSAEVVPTWLTDVQAIAAGAYHAVALKKDGSVVTWGYLYGYIGMPYGMKGVQAIAGGYDQTLGLVAAAPTLDLGSQQERSTGTPVTVTIRNTGDAPLVLGSITKDGSYPGDFAVSAPVNASIAPGGSTTFTLTFSPTAAGARPATLHLASNDGSASPFEIALSGLGVAVPKPQITVEQPGGTALVHSGSVAVWNAGLNTTLPDVDDAQAIAAGGIHWVVLKRDGTVAVSGGTNYLGQWNVPAGLAGVTAITAGNNHTLALKADGTVVAWGSNRTGETTVPDGLAGVTAIAAGDAFSAALKGDGTVVTWGRTSVTLPTNPVAVPNGLTGVKAIAAGTSHMLALKTDGTVVGWGFDNYGETRPPVGLTGVQAIAAGSSYSLALKTDGTLVMWGSNGSGWLAVPEGLTNVKSIAAGVDYALALKSDGSVVTWGRFGYDEARVPVDLPRVRAIAAGGDRALALVETTRTLDFSAHLLGSTGTSQLLTLRNTGDADLTLGAITNEGPNAGDFRVSLPTVRTIAPGGSATFTVTFTPSGEGERRATIHVPSNDASASPLDIDLMGSGIAPPHIAIQRANGTPMVPGSSLVIGDQIVGRTAGPVALTIRNTGGTDLTLGAITKSGANAGDFSISQPGTSTLAPGGSTTFAITFAPSAIGSRGATIRIPSNDANASPFEITLTGDGICPTITLANPPVATGMVGSAFSHAFAQRGGVGAVTFRLASGRLPEGLLLSPDGVLAGVPTRKGTYQFAIQAADSLGCIGVGPVFNLVIADDANLTQLALSRGTLSPAFDRLITSYTARVPNSVASITVTPTLSSALGRVRVNGGVVASGHASQDIPMKIGDNAILVVVTAADGKATKTYTIVVKRAGLPRIAVVREAGKPLELIGSPVAWGANFYGESTIPAGLTNVVALAGGSQHSLALKSDGTVLAWGDQDYAKPAIASRLRGVKQIAAGDAWSVALKQDGTLTVWGGTQFGLTAIPRGLTGVKAISAGAIHILALRSNGTGTVVAWGNGDSDQTRVPAGLKGVKAIAAGYRHSAALKDDGTVVAWGSRAFDGKPVVVPEGLSDVRQIAAGGAGTLALKNDGTVVAFGTPDVAWAEVPPGLSDVKAVSVGLFHFVAVKTDGSVVSWGKNQYGEATVPAGLTRVDSVSAAYVHNLALIRVTRAQDLGSQTAGTSGMPVAFTIRNTGSDDLALGTLTMDGLNASDFTLTQPASRTVPAGGSTTFTATFTPTAIGARAATVRIPSNDSEQSVFDVSLTGTGACPQITVSNPAVSHAILGQPYRQSFRQSGGFGPVRFSIYGASAPGFVLSADGELTGTPLTPGAYSLTVRVTDSLGCSGVSSGFAIKVAQYATAEDTPMEPVAFSVPAGATVTAKSSNLIVPDASIIIEGTGTERTLSFTPAPNLNGFFTITLRIDDHGTITTRTLSFVVTAVNDVPVALAPQIGRTVTTSPAVVSVDGHFTDVEGYIAKYSVVADRPEALGAGWGIDASTGLLELSTPPSGTTNGEVLLTVTATDGDGASASAVVKFNVGSLALPIVTPPVTPPVVNRRTGLYDWLLNVSNPNPVAITGYDVLVSGLPAKWAVWDSTTNQAVPRNASGQWIVHHGIPVPANSALTQPITFYNPSRLAATIHPQLSTLIVPSGSPPGAGSFGVRLLNVYQYPSGTQVSFESTPGQRYQVYSSTDGKAWFANPALIYSSGSTTMFVDHDAPTTGPVRQYFIQLVVP